MNYNNKKNLIDIVKPQLSRRQFLQISGISTMGFLLGGCGTPALEDLVGKLSS
jgi:hypothetical protein